jgi:hypothetical protein
MTEVLAMPYLCDSTDFGLSDEKANRKHARLLMEKPHKLIYDLGDGVHVYQTGSAQGGSLFLYNPATGLIGYYVHYKAMHKSLTGGTVTQTAVWRSLEEAKSKGLTMRVVFDYFLHHYPAIMSDKIQTDRGRDFWVDLMSQALARGHKVALADFSLRKIHEISGPPELRLWYSDPDDGAWGTLNKHQALRFIIRA